MNRLAATCSWITLLTVAAVGCSKESPAPAEPEPAPTAAAADPAQSAPAATGSALPDSVWQTPINTLAGEPSKLAAYRGKALLIVNVASKCGLTPQYAVLEQLQKKYSARGFTVLGFPCNQFGGQEPGTSEEIATFCSTTYGVTFPMFEKIEVNGDGRHPVYKELTAIADAKGEAGDIQWNFEKFVVSADGSTITRFRPRTSPDDPKVLAAIEAGLPKK